MHSPFFLLLLLLPLLLLMVLLLNRVFELQKKKKKILQLNYFLKLNTTVIRKYNFDTVTVELLNLQLKENKLTVLLCLYTKTKRHYCDQPCYELHWPSLKFFLNHLERWQQQHSRTTSYRSYNAPISGICWTLILLIKLALSQQNLCIHGLPKRYTIAYV